MDTQCLDCVFAEWKGDKQINCQWDRLEKFAERGTEIVEEEDKNTHKQYFRILGRICNTCRHPDTLKDTPTRQWKKKVREEITVRVAMIVYTDNDTDFDEAISSLESCYNQNLKPFEIILIYNNKAKDAPADYTLWFIAQNQDISWRIESIKGSPTLFSSEEIYYKEVMDLIIKSKTTKATYFTFCRAGYEYPEDYLEIIDKAINDELLRFIALKPDDDDNGLFVQVGLHRLLQGNKQIDEFNNIIEKIEYIASKEKTGHIIKTLEELREALN